MGIWDGVDFEDPCSALTVVREAYHKLSVSGHVAEIQFAERRVRYSQTNISELGALMRRLENECAAQQGGQRTRFAISAGYKRSWT